MKHKWIIFCFVLAAMVAAAYGLRRETHQFSSTECIICHIDAKGDPQRMKPGTTRSCQACHERISEAKSHPTDVFPEIPIPGDMPLTDGRMTCITCHYVHPEKRTQFIQKDYFLRRSLTGMMFCSACHMINQNKHMIFKDVHRGVYRVTNRRTRVDRTSLECIVCHDRYLAEPIDSLGAGRWQHFKKELNHPIGISYEEMTSGKLHNFKPAVFLRKEVKLYDGKIGCGTCHDIFSQEKGMLVMDNADSRLCRECHNK